MRLPCNQIQQQSANQGWTLFPTIKGNVRRTVYVGFYLWMAAVSTDFDYSDEGNYLE